MLPFFQSYHNINEINFAIKSNNSSKQDLFGLYKTIVRLNALSPFYKIDDTQEEQAFLLSIKDRAMTLSDSIESLYNNNTLFHHKVIWDNPNLLSAQLTRQDNIDLSQDVQILVEQLSYSQVNESLEKEENLLCPLRGTFHICLEIHDVIYDYEIHIPQKLTNGQLMESINNLINKSDIGINSIVVVGKNNNYKRLRFESDNARIKGQTFQFSDDNYSNKTLGPVEYLRLNHIIQPSIKSRIMVNGHPKESLSNYVTINDYLKIQLHNTSQEPVKISIVPDNEVIEGAVLQILNMYNDIISLAQTHRDNNRKCTKLLYDLSTTFLGYEEEFLSCGISLVNYHLLINDSLFNEAAKDGGLIGLFIRENSYFKNLINALTAVYLNPFNYINRTIVTYPNTLKPSYINPYITSIYSGMFLNYFC